MSFIHLTRQSGYPEKSNARLFFLRCGLWILLLLPASPALAELMLYPTRIVFEGNQRAAQIELINNGSERATYRISLVNRRMSKTGKFSSIDVPQPGEQFADDLLRYSPRQITLAPGSGQTVRILVRKPANLATGEYRSHLLFSKQPDPEGQNDIETRSASEDSIGVKLTMLVGASIPVIVRHGRTNANISLTNLELHQTAEKTPILALRLERSGNQSVYGDLAVSFTPRGGAEQVVARANGVAVYTPNPVRLANIALKPSDGIQLRDGVLRVTYREQAKDSGKLLGEASLQLP
ncbi:molecular chaperone [Marinobacter sp.]|uniref:fimbrial biogenesis chaperone n=1 Tax=Marinobacter sp. TaxID=50741 RepID=UPI003A8DC8A0